MSRPVPLNPRDYKTYAEFFDAAVTQLILYGSTYFAGDCMPDPAAPLVVVMRDE